MVSIQIKSKGVLLRFTPEQYRIVQQRAERCGLRPSAWMRSILLQAANRQSVEGHLRIKEPNGATT